MKRGSTGVAATKKSQFDVTGEFPERKERDITDVYIPPATGRGNITYSISNAMKYRDVALDLVGGRLGKSGNISYADQPAQDWYQTYADTQLRDRLQKSTNKVARLPKIKNFTG